MVEVMKIMETSFKRSCACTSALSAPDPAAGHHQPMPPLETPGHSWANLDQSLVRLVFLSPESWCAQGFVGALQESVSPVLCKFWQLYCGLMATSSKRAYAKPMSAAYRAPALQQATADLYLCQRHSNTVLAQCLWALWVLVFTRFV